MDQGTYSYLKLAETYDNFLAPDFTVFLDGKKLEKSKYTIPSVEIEISATGTAGGCSFRIEGQYDFKNSKWVNDAGKLVKPGATIEITGGYQEQKALFYGYIDEFNLDFKSDGTPYIEVNGLDGLGYLMNMCQPLYAGEKKPKEIVEAILKKCKSAGYARDVKVGTLEGFETPIIKEQIDDWKFLCMMAERYGVSLFAVNGELIFDEVLTKTTPIITLTIGRNIRNFNRRVSLAHQVGKVEVLGRDVNQKAVKGTASNVTTGGDGKTAAQWVSGLSESVLRIRSEYARTQKECETLAQNRLNSISMGFVSGSGQCIGIPELIPGRYIKIDGGDDLSNGTYFLTKVVHHIQTGMYVTSFEIKGAKA